MSNVKSCLAQKTHGVFSLPPTALVVEALELMRNNKVRSVLVIEGEQLVGIVTQGDCAIKVLLPGLSAGDVTLSEIMTRDPMSVTTEPTLDHCMKTMINSRIRHLPVVEGGRVLGMVSIGDIVKDIIQQQDQHIRHLETYIKGHGVPY